ncbi:MAG: c-type cytochrome biogenesis protein CcsB [Treponema sp.]|jgi:cytochrome c-type biogenesis protein CcsB|nr:c-type cytochrome biogenesis protein CcsB [Treponema sp.]
MLNALFFSSLALYLLSVILYFTGMALKTKIIPRIVWFVFLAGFLLHTGYFLGRGMVAGRLPLSNQFEFAMSLSWGVGLIYIILRIKFKADWITAVALPSVFLILFYASFLPRDIKELMPALRSPWFGFHIGAAVVSYASFVLAGCAGIRYLLLLKKGEPEDGTHLRQIDSLSYRLIGLGMIMLTVVILSGSVWAEQAWSSFWSWDPKELWSLITWLVYAIYLHQRLRKKWRGKPMAIFSFVAVIIVLFTFIGVNTLLSGLHSYR